MYDGFGGLRALTQLPRLHRLTVENNGMVGLAPLTGCRTLQRLCLSNVASVGGGADIDLTPLVRMPSLRVLEIVGVLTKVELATLAGASLDELTLAGRMARHPVGLGGLALGRLTLLHPSTDIRFDRLEGLHTVELSWTPEPETVRALNACPTLRNLLLRVPAGDPPPGLRPDVTTTFV